MTECDPHCGTFFHCTQYRIISIREAARLQSFSDWFKFIGSSIQEFMAARYPNLPPGCLKTWLSYERFLGLSSLFFVLSLSACSNLAALRQEHRHIIGFQETHHISTETITNLAASNNEMLIRYKKEHEYRKGIPKYCLRLSGGGVRSAWYSIGVMKALAKAKRLDSLDVISATSGGSYALGWYYSAMLREIDNKSIPDTGIGRDAALFEGQEYRDLQKSYDVVFKTDRIPSGEDNWIEQGLIAIFSFAYSPFGLLGPPGDSFGREMYQAELPSVFRLPSGGFHATRFFSY